MSNVSSSNSHKALSPRLRFPEFNDEWTMMEAETLFDNIVVKNCPHETVLTIIQGKGTVPRNEAGRNIHYDEQIINSSIKMIILFIYVLLKEALNSLIVVA